MKSLILLIFLITLQVDGNPIPNSNSLDFEHHIIPRPRPRPDVAQDVIQGTISNLLVKYKNSDYFNHVHVLNLMFLQRKTILRNIMRQKNEVLTLVEIQCLMYVADFNKCENP